MIYVVSEMYIINFLTIFFLFVVFLGTYQINTLFSKGELGRFIMGRYHRPRELERYFCFIDLNHSTTIAEQLGHVRFGSFLKDYFTDLSDAIRYSGAEIYQYVGDEVVLTWPVSGKTNLNKVIGSIFLMKEVFWTKSNYYKDRYEIVPEFKAGLHGGPVLVTWIGEVKKQIIYLGDVLNTCSRIMNQNKPLKTNFLISGYVMERLGSAPFSITAVGDLQLRGKREYVSLFRVDEK
jgi:adenylate cyclase